MTTRRLPFSLATLLWLVVACSDTGEHGTPPSEPPPPPPPPAPLFDRIVFMRRTPTGNQDLYRFGLWTVRPDGSDLRVLRDSLNYPSSTAVSPDGRVVAFEDWGVLNLIDSDGGNLRALNTGQWRSYQPRWTPDGLWIYFSAQAGPQEPTQLFRIRPDATGRQQLSFEPGGARFPALSRDGRYLAYVRARYVDGLTPAWLVIRDLTTGGEELASDSTFTGRFGQWAPDNRSLLFLDGNPTAPNRWALLRFDLSTKTYGFFLESQGNRPATYSPDGRTLLYGTGDLWLADSNGTNARQVLADGMQNFEAYWTPASP